MLTFEVDDQVTPLLHLIDERLSDLTIPLARIVDDGLFSAQQQVFEGKGAAFGGSGWAPMAERTIRTGRDPSTLLVDTGALLSSLGRGAAGNIFEVSSMESQGGTSLSYAGAQQNGTSRIPARPFLVWYAERFDTYDAMVLDWIMAGEAAGNA